MTDRYPDRESVAAKIEWEGGIAAALDYGIHAGDMPEGDTALAAAWQRLEAAYAVFDLLAGDVQALLDAPDAEPEPKLTAVRRQLDALADSLEKSAAITAPSKKSQVEAEFAISVRDIGRQLPEVTP